MSKEEETKRKQDKEAKWVEAQILGFTSFVNSFLARRKQKIENLETDFKDGLRLADFLEVAGNVELQGIDYFPKGKIQSIQNISICLQFMASLNIRLLGINAGTIYDGNLKLILGMLYSAIRSPAFTKLSSQSDSANQAKQGKQSFEEQLLGWIRERVASYGLTVTDFKTSFNDGRVFGALIHSIDPKAIDLDSLKADDSRHNLTHVFDAALNALQVPKLLSADDMAIGNSDERSIVLYSTLLFHAGQAAGVKEEGTKIKTTLEKEKEEKHELELELKTLQNDILETQDALSAQSLVSDGLLDENERLKKLIDYYQHRSKVADSAIRALETKANILDQLSGDREKKIFHSPNLDLSVDADDAEKLAGKRGQPGEGSAWFFVPSEDGKDTFNVLHCKSGKFLSLEENGAGGNSATLSSDIDPKAEWRVVSPDHKNKEPLVQNVATGEYLRLGPDGSVGTTSDPNDHCLVVQSKSDYEKKNRLQNESAMLGAALVENGGNTLIRHGKSKKFVSADAQGKGAHLDQSLKEGSKWETLLNADGSVSFRSKENGQFLSENEKGAAGLSKDHGDESSWWIARTENGKDTVMINKASGHYLQQDDDGSLGVSEGLDANKGSWRFQTEQENLAAFIANGIASSGGLGQIQHGWTQHYVNNKPGLSTESNETSKWNMTANPDGSLTIANNQNGKLLSQSVGSQNVSLSSDSNDPSARWNVSRLSDGSILVSNRATGDYLVRLDDGSFRVSSEKDLRVAGWIFNSDNGAFSSSTSHFGDAMLGHSLAAALKACGGAALLQHGKSEGYINNAPGLSADVDDQSKWEVVDHDDGSWSLRSKENGKFVSLDDDGNLAMSGDADTAVSSWTVSQNAKGDIVIRNKATGDYLERRSDGKLGVNGSYDEDRAGWTVKSENGIFSSKGKGDALLDGFSLKELEARSKLLQNEISSAEMKLKEEAEQRERLRKEIEELKEYLRLNEKRASEADKTMEEMRKKLSGLQGLFDQERSNKSKVEDARALMEKELNDKELLLKEINEKREQLARQLEAAKAAAQREVSARKEKEAEIRALERAKAALQKKIVISGKTLSGLDSVKRNLEEHLEELSAWRSNVPAGSLEDAYGVDKISKELEGKPFEEQIKILDSKLKTENKCLLRILNIQSGIQKLEEKVLREGWLFIKGRKDWKQRWCVLSGHLLRYYNTDDTSEAADGCVDLSVGCDIVRQKAMKEGKVKVWPLKLSITTNDEDGNEVVRKLFLRASSKAERHSWFSAISCMTTCFNYLSDVEKAGERPDTRILSFISAGEATTIHELYVDHRAITPSGSNALYKGILYHDNILTLSMQQAQMGDFGVHKLCTALDKVTDLRVLRLAGNLLTSDSVGALIKALCIQNTSLRELDLSNNAIDGTGVVDIEELLKTNVQLSTLNFTGNCLRDAGVSLLADALSKLKSPIPILDLGHNQIGDSGAAELAKLIKANPNITTIRLAGNNIGDEGAIKIAEAAHAQPNIQSIDLSGNNIGPLGARALRQMLADNRDIRSLDISANPKLVGSKELDGFLLIDGYAVSSLTFVRHEDVAA